MIQSAFKKYLDLEFSDPSQGIVVHIYERPGHWMSDDRLVSLITDLRGLVKVSLKDETLDYGALTGDREVLKNIIITVIYDKKTKEIMAFNSLCYMPCKLGHTEVNVLHLGLVLVRPDVRQGGFSWILYGLTTTLIFLRNRLNTIWVTNVSQVPAIIGRVAETFGEVYPNPIDPKSHSFKHLILAREIMKHHRHVFGVGGDAVFRERDFVIENSYTGGSDHLKKTFQESAHHRKPVFNEFCQKHLDYDRGDDFLQLGNIQLQTIYDYVTKDIPSKSIMSMIALSAYMILQGMILPLMSWFQANHQQGMIRPWKAK